MTPSASATNLLLRCQWWARPEVEAPPEEPNPDMLRGTGGHAAIEAHLTTGTAAPSDAAAPFFASWLRWWQTKPFGTDGTYHVEKALSYDTTTDTAKFTGAQGRAYNPAPGEIPGRPDLVIFQEKRVIVADWKSGEDWAGYAAEGAPAQLRTYALAAARIAGVDEAIIVACQITPGEVVATPETLDVFDLDAHAEKLKLAMTSLETALPVPGGHCLRCPALAVCPAHDTAKLEKATALPVITAENAGPMYLAMEALESRVAQMKKACKAQIIAAGKVPMPDGGTLEMVTAPVEGITLDGPQGPEAEAAIIQAGAPKAIDRPPATATKKAITDALGAKASRPLFEKLRALGALRETHGRTAVKVNPPDVPLAPVRARVRKPAALPALSTTEAVAMLAAPAVPAPVVVPEPVPAPVVEAPPELPIYAFVDAAKAAQTLDDLRELRRRFDSTEWMGTSYTTAAKALKQADNRVSR